MSLDDYVRHKDGLVHIGLWNVLCAEDPTLREVFMDDVIWLNGQFQDETPADPHFKSGPINGACPPVIGAYARVSKSALLDCSAQITIGPYAFFGHRVMVLTAGHDPQQFGEARQKAITARPVTVGEGAWICSGAILCPGVTIGEHAVVGPGAVVMRNVPPYTVVAGNPARRVRKLARGAV